MKPFKPMKPVCHFPVDEQIKKLEEYRDYIKREIIQLFTDLKANFENVDIETIEKMGEIVNEYTELKSYIESTLNLYKEEIETITGSDKLDALRDYVNERIPDIYTRIAEVKSIAEQARTNASNANARSSRLETQFQTLQLTVAEMQESVDWHERHTGQHASPDCLGHIFVGNGVEVDEDGALNIKVGTGLAIGEDGRVYATGSATVDSVEWGAVQNVPETFPPAEHTHTAQEIGALDANGTAKDSAKLCGKSNLYYIQKRNLLDNSNFSEPINQRGATTYVAEGAEIYSIDRWKLGDGNTLTVNSSSITIGNGGFKQFIPAKKANKDVRYTVAFCTTDGTIATYASLPSLNANSQNFELGYDEEKECVYVSILQAGSYKWVALYEGDYTQFSLPPYVAKEYATELNECMRYYLRFAGTNMITGVGAVGSQSQFTPTFYLPCVMRKTPTVEKFTLNIIRGNGANISGVTPTEIKTARYSGNNLTISIKFGENVLAPVLNHISMAYVDVLAVSADL